MKTSKTWLVLGWAAILALVYVGHGLHQGAPGVAPFGWEQSLQAQETHARKLDWTKIGGDAFGVVTRAQVPGGWLVQLYVNTPQGGAAAGLTFVPDADHKWNMQ
jgi:hypothetical protein